MQFLIVFACALAAATASAGHLVAPVYAAPQHLPVIGANGVPVDTPAVQQATAAHLTHKVDAIARNGDYAYGYAANWAGSTYAHGTPVVGAYAHGSPVVASTYAHGSPVVGSTYAHGSPIVASTYAHGATYAHATPVLAHHTPAAYPTTAGWPTNVNGVPLETPEVAAAKTNHFAAHAEAHARNGDYAIAAPVVASTYAHAAPVVASTYAHAAPVVASTYAHAAPVVASTYAHAAPVVAGTYAHTAIAAHYHPAAYPTTGVYPTSVNGVPLETPEVVAAKAKHFAAHAEALTRHTRGIYTPSVYGAHAYGAYPYTANYAHYY